MVFLSSQPLWLSFLLAVVLPTGAAIGGGLLIRRIFGLERLLTNNEVAGFKFAVVGVVYAVLLGFAVIVVWEKFRDAEVAVGQEAAAIVSIERLSQGLSPAVGDSARQRLAAYTRAAIADDWPAMAKGNTGALAARALDGLYAAVVAEPAATPREAAVLAEVLGRLDSLTQARRARLLLATGVVPGVVWSVLFAGAIVTLTFTFFFGVRSAGSQVIMTGMLATLIFMALYVAIEIDHPFTGPTSIGPEMLQTGLEGGVAPQ
ncbi:MAG: DUF4239 domain-containing protein [Caulobacteraceae bacterium]